MSELTEVFSKHQQQFASVCLLVCQEQGRAEDIVMGAFTNVLGAPE